MDDMRVGAAFRAVRLRRRWRQSDVAARAGVSRALVSLVERGHIDSITLATLRRSGRVLDIRIDMYARWRGGELDRLLNARHSLLSESVVASFGPRPAWVVYPEVSFSVYGERGIFDLLAFHALSGSLLVIELKTLIVDFNELVGTLDRKARLAPGIASARGWDVATVSRWVIVEHDRTNLRRMEAHRSMLRAAFPVDGRVMRGWLRDPVASVSALSSWPNAIGSSARPTTSGPVRVSSSRVGRG